MDFDFAPYVNKERAARLVDKLDEFARKWPRRHAKAKEHTKIIVESMMMAPKVYEDDLLVALSSAMNDLKPKHRKTVERFLPCIMFCSQFIGVLGLHDAEYVEGNKQSFIRDMKAAISTGNYEAFAYAEANPCPQPSGFPTLEEVEEERQSLAQTIFENHHLLQKIIKYHGLKIQDWWMKKSSSDRRKRLLHAWPEINVRHRMDIEAVTHKKLKTSLDIACKWPHLNLEDLTQNGFFLILLHDRAHYSPWQFVRADHESCQLGIASSAIRPLYLHTHRMHFIDRDDVQRYGELVPIEELEGPGSLVFDGLTVLEIQAKLYEFLVKCCLETTQMSLEDLIVPPEETKGSKVSKTPRASRASRASKASKPPKVSKVPKASKSSKTSKGFTESEETEESQEVEAESGYDIRSKAPQSFGCEARSYVQASYRVPGQLNLDSLSKLIVARRSLALENLAAIRSDPEFFADRVFHEVEHNFRQIATEKNKTPGLESDPFWTGVFRYAALYPIDDAFLWDYLHTCVLRTSNELHNHPNLSPSDTLPEDLRDALIDLLALSFFGIRFMATRLEELAKSPSSTRGYYSRDETDNTIHDRESMKHPRGLDEFVGLLAKLMSPMWTLLLGWPTLVAEVERSFDVERNKQLAKLLTPYFQHAFSDVCLMAECISQISLFQPWITECLRAAFWISMRIEDRLPGLHLLEPILQAISADAGLEVTKPLRKLNYPIQKKRTKELTLKLQEAERNLASFWNICDTAARQDLEDLTASSHCPDILAILNTPPPGEITPDWIEPAKTVKTVTLGTKRQYDEFARDLGQQSEESPSKHVAKKAKTKLKTKGVADPSRVETKLPEPEPESEDEMIYEVKESTMKVLRSLFYQENTGNQPGVMDWKDFVQAMADIGFGVEATKGSAWYFAPPPQLRDKGPIMFHSPHPKNGHGWQVARRMGRRLTRHYGMERRMFKVKGSD